MKKRFFIALLFLLLVQIITSCGSANNDRTSSEKEVITDPESETIDIIQTEEETVQETEIETETEENVSLIFPDRNEYKTKRIEVLNPEVKPNSGDGRRESSYNVKISVEIPEDWYPYRCDTEYVGYYSSDNNPVICFSVSCAFDKNEGYVFGDDLSIFKPSYLKNHLYRTVKGETKSGIPWIASVDEDASYFTAFVYYDIDERWILSTSIRSPRWGEEKMIEMISSLEHLGNHENPSVEPRDNSPEDAYPVESSYKREKVVCWKLYYAFNYILDVGVVKSPYFYIDLPEEFVIDFENALDLTYYFETASDHIKSGGRDYFFRIGSMIGLPDNYLLDENVIEADKFSSNLPVALPSGKSDLRIFNNYKRVTGKTRAGLDYIIFEDSRDSEYLAYAYVLTNTNHLVPLHFHVRGEKTELYSNYFKEMVKSMFE